jgi:hypothetical protein
MARLALRGERFITNEKLSILLFRRMAGRASDFRVRTCKRKRTPDIVIENQVFPAGRCMTAGTGFSPGIGKLSSVRVRMAAAACGTHSFVQRACRTGLLHMTFIACSGCMLSCQWKIRFIMIKYNLLPYFSGMA